MVAWKRRTFEAGHGSRQSVESQRENRPSALWYCWNDAGEMVARRRALNEVRAVSRSGNVALRKEERAVERSEAGGGKEASGMEEPNSDHWVERYRCPWVGVEGRKL